MCQSRSGIKKSFYCIASEEYNVGDGDGHNGLEFNWCRLRIVAMAGHSKSLARGYRIGSSHYKRINNSRDVSILFSFRSSSTWPEYRYDGSLLDFLCYLVFDWLLNPQVLNRKWELFANWSNFLERRRANQVMCLMTLRSLWTAIKKYAKTKKIHKNSNNCP